MSLPKVFQNNNINFNNISQSVFYSDKDNTLKDIVTDKYLIEKKINELFNSKSYVYKLNVIIKTNNEEIKTTVIGRTQKYLITLDSKKIDISSILDIKEDN